MREYIARHPAAVFIRSLFAENVHVTLDAINDKLLSLNFGRISESYFSNEQFIVSDIAAGSRVIDTAKELKKLKLWDIRKKAAIYESIMTLVKDKLARRQVEVLSLTGFESDKIAELLHRHWQRNYSAKVVDYYKLFFWNVEEMDRNDWYYYQISLTQDRLPILSTLFSLEELAVLGQDAGMFVLGYLTQLDTTKVLEYFKTYLFMRFRKISLGEYDVDAVDKLIKAFVTVDKHSAEKGSDYKDALQAFEKASLSKSDPIDSFADVVGNDLLSRDAQHDMAGDTLEIPLENLNEQ